MRDEREVWASMISLQVWSKPINHMAKLEVHEDEEPAMCLWFRRPLLHGKGYVPMKDHVH